MMNRIIALFFCLLISIFAAGCSTTSSSSQGDEEVATNTPTAPAGFDEEILRYSHVGAAPIVLKVNVDALEDEILPVVEPIATQIMGPVGAAMVEGFAMHGPVVLSGDVFVDDRHLEELDHDRAAYVTRQVLAGEGYFDAFEYGAVIQPEEVEPVGIHTRLMLPSEDPEALAELMRSQLNPNRQAAVTAGEAYVRLDYLELRFQPDDPEALLEEAVAQVADVEEIRHTPALQTFADSQAPLSVYFKSNDLRLYFAAELMLEAREALEYATPENRQRMLAMGTVGAQNALALSPNSQFEHEDTAVELRADDAGGLVFDATSTLSEHGIAVATNIGAPRTLQDVPTLDDDPSEVGNIRWNFDLPKATEQGELRNGSQGGELTPATVAEAFRMGGIGAYLQSFFITPSYLPRLVADYTNYSLPTAGYLSFRIPPDERRPQLSQLGATGIFQFDQGDVVAADLPYIAGFRQDLERSGVASQFDATEAGEGATNLGFRVSHGTESEGTQDIEIGSELVDVDMDLAPILNAQGNGPAIVEIIGDLTHLRGNWSVEGNITRQRVHFGTGELARPEIAAVEGFEPAGSGPACISQVVESTMNIFEALEFAGGRVESAEDFLGHFEHYDAAVQDCQEQSPELAEDLELARARVRYLTRIFVLQHEDREEIEAGIRDASCAIGDPVVCQ